MIINCVDKNKVRIKKMLFNSYPLCFLWTYLFTTMSYNCLAQQKINPDSVTHYKVKYSNNDYIFLPADNYLFEGGKNKIKITNTKGRPFEVKMVNGDIKKLGEIVFLKLMGWLIWAKLFYQFMKQNLMVLKK